MNERPILFSGEMVRAILDGRKTQTRRVLKPQPPLLNCTGAIINSSIRPDEHWQLSDYEGAWGFRGSDGIAVSGAWKCPYGKLGDRLWVRETWNAVHFVPEIVEGHVTKYSDHWFVSDEIPKNSNNGYWSLCYAADCDSFELEIVWRPSIFMPRWASRITLEVVNVRVERLQDISEEDAMAEGVMASGGWNADDTEYCVGYRTAFSRLWDSINAKRNVQKVSEWKLWTWGWNKNDDPDAIGLDIVDPTKIQWRNRDDYDLPEWVTFGEFAPSENGQYDVIWQEGDAPVSVYLRRNNDNDDDNYEYPFSWAANPWVWVIEFKNVSGEK